MKKKHYINIILTAVIIMIYPMFSFAVEKEIISGSEVWNNPLINENIDLEKPLENKRTPLSLVTIDNYEDLKNEIYQSMLDRDEHFEINYTGDTSTLSSDINEILDEINLEDEYLANSKSSYSWSYSGYVNDVDVIFDVVYIHDKEEEDYIENRVDEILSEIIDEDMTDLEKIKAVNDYVVLNTSYDKDTYASAHSPYAILSENKGVCQAYALLTYKMLDKLGFSQRYVSGEAGGEGHAWNLVNLNDEWYMLDVTWNDPLPDRKCNVNYKYFLVNNDYLDDNHYWEKSDYPLANSDDYSYFHQMSNAYSDDMYIYYSNELDGDVLYKATVDGLQNIRLNDNRSYYIVSYGNWIYYSDYSNGGYLYKIRIDGSEETRLNTVHSTNLYLKENQLYYTNNSTGAIENITLEEVQPPYNWSEPFSKKNSVNINKEWNISFNKPINEASVNNENVFIAKDINGVSNIVNTDIVLAKNNEIKVYAPVNGWETGETYYLFISENIQSQDGELLNKGIRMQFSVE